MDATAPLDLPAYLARIEYAGARRATAEVLHALHLAHATHIPFENLDVLAGRPIRLDVASLQAKLVGARRGGYCFEQNLLFAAVLRAFGFAVVPLAARVRYRTNRVLPRTHMLLRVEAEGGRWIADVGFGGEGLLLPLPLDAGVESRHYAWTYRLAIADGEWVLQSQRQGAWADLYAFTEAPQHPADLEMANYYASTHPDSRFVQTLTVQLPTPSQRLVLRGRELIYDRGETVETRRLADAAEVVAALRDVFGLPVPPGTRFPEL